MEKAKEREKDVLLPHYIVKSKLKLPRTHFVRNDPFLSMLTNATNSKGLVCYKRSYVQS